MSDSLTALEDIAKKLKENPTYEHLRLTTRGLLHLFSAERRGSSVVQTIKGQLKKLGIETEPNFENTWIDAPIKLRLIPSESKQHLLSSVEDHPTSSDPEKEEEDPTFRIGRLEAVSRSLLSVKPDDSIAKAVTIMLLHDYSQIPVMTTERTIKGMLTWKCISSSLALGGSSVTAKDCMTSHFEVRDNISLFEAMPGIITHGYVIIRSEDSSIAGILTVGDLSLEFRQLTEPFLLLQQIEKHLRNLLSRIAQSDFKSKCSQILAAGVTEGEVSGDVADLSLGDYLRLLEDQSFWELLSIKVDRAPFVNELHEVRKIRNRVMHFDQDGLKEKDKDRLRNSSTFFQTLSTLLHSKPKAKR